jgi:site-specific recombinase XerD
MRRRKRHSTPGARATARAPRGALVNAGRDTRSLQGYLGNKNIRHTEKYTKLSPDRFKDFGKGAW